MGTGRLPPNVAIGFATAKLTLNLDHYSKLSVPTCYHYQINKFCKATGRPYDQWYN